MFLKKHASFIVAGTLLALLIVSVFVSLQETNTFDERAHIPAAYSYVRYGDMRLNPEHPPLIKDLAGLPLLFFDLTFPINDPDWTEGVNQQWTLGEKFLYESGNNPDVINFWSRLPIILISLLLGFFIYRWTKELAGTTAGLFALILYAADPNIIGHNHYVTTDIGIAAFLFLAMYFFTHFLKRPSRRNIILAGIFLGLAQIAKFSAVLLFPLTGLLVILYALAKQTPNDNTDTAKPTIIARLFEYLWKYAAIVAICFAVISVAYTLNTWNMPLEKVRILAQTSFNQKTAVANMAASFVIYTSHIPIIAPLSEYFLGVFMVFARVAGGNTYYFLGTVSNIASPAYFPIVFLLKETLPFLFLLIFSILYTLFRAGKNVLTSGHSWLFTLAQSIRDHIAQYGMAGFILLYAYLSITGNLNIGFRHLFPILPFLYVLTAKTVFDFIKHKRQSDAAASHTTIADEKHRHVLSVIAGLFTFWIVSIPVLSYPSYISYYNEAAGGHENGYQYATDSNYDWGQGLIQLRTWIDTYNSCLKQPSSFPNHTCNTLTLNGTFPDNTPIDNIRIDYFGGANPRYYFGDRFIPWYDTHAPEAGWYAISASYYQESIHKAKKNGEGSYEWLSRFELVGRAGDSMFIFHIAPEDLEKIPLR